MSADSSMLLLPNAERFRLGATHIRTLPSATDACALRFDAATITVSNQEIKWVNWEQQRAAAANHYSKLS
jgi:hypothetical protein